MAVMQIPIPARRTLPRKRMETFWGHSKILLQPTEKRLDITATVCYFLEGRKLKLSIQVENHSGFTISQVFGFPCSAVSQIKERLCGCTPLEQAFLTQDAFGIHSTQEIKTHKGTGPGIITGTTSDILSFFPPHGWIIPTKPAESA